ncbi:MAG: GatB/YqeY domain-containing protein [Bacilli bacterium]
MNLLEQLKLANLEALKTRDKNTRAILSVVINKVTTKEKEHNTVLSDEEVLLLIIKANKELEEEKAGYVMANNLERVESIEAQINALDIYIPKQLSETEIRKEIDKLDDKTLPNIMKHFKMNFAGRADLSLVSRVARSL